MNLADKIINETKLLERFLTYVKENTQSDPKSLTSPSTNIQKNLAKKLVLELKGLGVEATTDKFGFVYAKIPSNCNVKTKVAFFAHLDVSFDCKGLDVKPIVHKNYDCEDIKLNGTVISPKENPELLECKGHSIITSDGTTLLGADDKAGIAAIMSMVEFVLKNDVKRPEIRICFTPDEEIGRGVNNLDLNKLDADFGYTVDGGFPFEIEFENFYAHKAVLSFEGKAHHPGYAIGKMVNSINFASKFVQSLPENKKPETTKLREPFIHVISIKGKGEFTEVELILRAFEKDEILELKEIILSEVEFLMKKEQRLSVDVLFEEQYKNMYEIMKDNSFVVDYAVSAIKSLGYKPNIKAARGGTDGSKISFMGVPCPNIFAGGVNFHSTKEFVSLESMAKSSAVLVEIVKSIK
jgi:tripeptide aminopeptidase